MCCRFIKQSEPGVLKSKEHLGRKKWRTSFKKMEKQLSVCEFTSAESRQNAKDWI